MVSPNTLTNGVPKVPEGFSEGFCHFWHCWVCPVPTDRLPLSHSASSQSNLFVI